MSTVHVAIGNSDDKLPQEEWAGYWTDVDVAIRSYSGQVYGAWLSAPNSMWQNACWAFEPGDAEHTDILRERLQRYARIYDQDSIAWCEGETEFLGSGA